MIAGTATKQAALSVLQRMARYQQDLLRRGIAAEEAIAFIVTNEEALQLLAEALPHFTVGAADMARKWIADGEGWQASGRLKFFNRHICVLR